MSCKSERGSLSSGFSSFTAESTKIKNRVQTEDRFYLQDSEHPGNCFIFCGAEGAVLDIQSAKKVPHSAQKTAFMNCSRAEPTAKNVEYCPLGILNRIHAKAPMRLIEK